MARPLFASSDELAQVPGAGADLGEVVEVVARDGAEALRYGGFTPRRRP